LSESFDIARTRNRPRGSSIAQAGFGFIQIGTGTQRASPPMTGDSNYDAAHGISLRNFPVSR
jgi:hypothetical protein